MRWPRKLRLRLRSLLDRSGADNELDDELRFHLEREIEANISSGMSRDEAGYAARRLIGDVEQRKEECRDMRRVNFVENLLQDLRYGARMLRKSPTFTAIAVLTLAVGIGANTAIFSFVDAVLFRPPPIHDATSLATVFTTVANERRSSSAYADFRGMESGSHKLVSWAAYSRVPLNWMGSEQAEVIWGEVATENYFPALGIAARLGRTFTAEDATAPVVVLESRFWRERWKADPGVIGRPMRLSSRTYTIVGVMPDGFRGTSNSFTPAAWIPLATWTGITKEELYQPDRRWLEVAARLAPGATMRQASAELAALSAHLQSIPNRPNEQRTLVALSDREARLSRDRTFALFASMLAVLVGIVLLVACSNVASLLLTRTLARRKEIALRQSLGASRNRIVRQLLTEGLLLAGAGAIAGAILASWAVRFLTAYQIPSPVPLAFDAHLDTRTLAFTTLAAVATSFLFGLMPAMEAARTDLIGRIRRQQQRVRRGLDLMVAVQVAGGVVLMTGASLFLDALGRAAKVNPGFTPDHALAMTVDPSLLGYSREQSVNFYRQLLERTRAIPGVRAAGLTKSIPLGFGGSAPVGVILPGGETQKLLRTRYNIVDGDFFPALGTRLIRGRAFLSTDTGAAPPVAVVNESLARALFAGKDPIGERVCIAGPPAECRQIVGLAEQGKYGTLAEEPEPYYFIPFAQRFAAQMTLVIRTQGEPAEYSVLVRRAAAALEPGVPVIEVRTLQEHMRIPMLEPRIPAFFLTSLSAIGLMLSLAGILGVTAYAVSSRTKEIGIRMAIGARRVDVLWVILRHALGVVAVAILLGTAMSLGYGKLVSSLLYGLDPADPIRLGSIAVLMSVAMLMGSLIPAYSATRIDPAITLREE